MYRLQLFGGVFLEGPSGPVSGKAVQRRQLALLAMLGTGNEGGWSRDKLVGCLWPERDQETARHRLSGSLYELRKTLGDDAVVAVGETLRLNPDAVSTDLGGFEAALELGDLERAVDFYAGPFLDGFYLGGSREFDDWLETERQRLRGLYETALERLANDAEDSRVYPMAVTRWQKLTTSDPYNSRFALRLMQAMAAAGDPANAILHASEHERLLKEELDLELPADVFEFGRQLREEPASPAVADQREATDAAGVPAAPAPAVPRIEPLRRRRSILVIGGLASVALVIGIAFAITRLPWKGSDAVLEPKRVAVLPFINVTGEAELDYISRQTAEVLGAAIQRHEIGEVVPTPIVYAALARIGDTRGIERLARETGAGTVVSGSYYLRGDSLGFHVSVTDVALRRQIGAFGPVRSPKAVPGLGIEIAEQQLLATLAMAFDLDVGAAASISGYPPLEVYRVFADGKAAWLEREYDRSIELLREAMEMDTTFVVVPLVWLIPAHWYVYDPVAMDSLLRFAERYDSQTSQYHRYVLDGYRGALSGDREVQYRSVRAAAMLAPDNYWTSRYAVFLSLWTNRPKEAIEWAEGILPAVDDDPSRAPRILWAVALSYHRLGRYAEELAAISRLEDIDPDNSMSTASAVRAFAALGRRAEVQARVSDLTGKVIVDDAYQTFAAALLAAQELRAHDMGAISDSLLQRVVTYYEGQSARTPEDLFRLGLAYYLAGRWGEAHDVLLRLSRAQVPSQPYHPQRVEPDGLDYLAFLGLAAARLGDQSAALSVSERLRKLDEPLLYGHNTAYRARIAAILGRREEATRLLAQAMSEGMHQLGIMPRHRWHFDFETLSDYKPYTDLLRPRG